MIWCRRSSAVTCIWGMSAGNCKTIVLTPSVRVLAGQTIPPPVRNAFARDIPCFNRDMAANSAPICRNQNAQRRRTASLKNEQLATFNRYWRERNWPRRMRSDAVTCPGGCDRRRSRRRRRALSSGQERLVGCRAAGAHGTDRRLDVARGRAAAAVQYELRRRPAA